MPTQPKIFRPVTQNTLIFYLAFSFFTIVKVFKAITDLISEG